MILVLASAFLLNEIFTYYWIAFIVGLRLWSETFSWNRFPIAFSTIIHQQIVLYAYLCTAACCLVEENEGVKVGVLVGCEGFDEVGCTVGPAVAQTAPIMVPSNTAKSRQLLVGGTAGALKDEKIQLHPWTTRLEKVIGTLDPMTLGAISLAQVAWSPIKPANKKTCWSITRIFHP